MCVGTRARYGLQRKVSGDVGAKNRQMERGVMCGMLWEGDLGSCMRRCLSWCQCEITGASASRQQSVQRNHLSCWHFK